MNHNQEPGNPARVILQTFMDTVSDAMIIYDENLNCVELNEVARKQINLKKEEIVGKNIREIIPNIEETNRYEKYRNLIKLGVPFEEEVADHPFSNNKVLLLKAFKVNKGIGIITTDITSAKEELNKELILKKKLEFLKDSALDLVQLSHEDDLYSYTAQKLSSIIEDSFIIVNTLDHKSNRVIISGISAEKKFLRIANKLVGSKLIGRSFPYYKNAEVLKTGRLTKLNPKLYDISGGEIPMNICKVIENVFGIREIYTAGFTRRNNLYGNVYIITNIKDIKLDHNLIEAFISQISIAIHRFASEKDLRDSEHQFQVAFTTSPDSVNINRLQDGIYVDVNEGFTQITGYKREDVIGKSSLELEIWNNPRDREKLINELLTKGSVKNMDATFKIKSGELIAGLISAHIIKKDGIDHIISITRDITDRIHAERSLIESEERYRIVANQTGQIIYDYNIESGEISWAGAIERVTGYTPEEFSRVNIAQWEKMIHRDDIENSLILLNEAIENHSSYDVEYRFKHKDGYYIHIEEHGLCILSSDNSVQRMLGSMADITEQKEYHRSMEVAWKKAQESDSLKTAFLANLSHEIRTPMNAILGFSSLLMNAGISEKSRVEYIEMINKSSLNLLSIINDILDFSMIETGQLQIYRKAFSIKEVLDELYATFTQFKEMENKNHIGLFLNVESFSEYHDLVISDEERIKQVMINLLGNAVKYTLDGEIHFGWDLKTTMKNKPEIEFFVSDTGVGIPADMHEVIFERFRQLDQSTTRTHGGNGLGLAISKQIANLLDGDIKVVSEPGKGSTFYFTIPYLPAKETRKLNTGSISVNDYQWGNKTIIVAEDDHSNFFLVKSMLEKTGVQLIWAKDGEEAVSEFEKCDRCDCILMDVRMPKLNGYEATTEIRKTDPKVPIIALSANAMNADIHRSKEIGCNDHISKPVYQGSLLAALAKYLK